MEAREVAKGEMMKSKGMWKTLMKEARSDLTFGKAHPSLFIKRFVEVVDEASHEYRITCFFFEDDQKANGDLWSPRWQKPEGKEKVKLER